MLAMSTRLRTCESGEVWAMAAKPNQLTIMEWLEVEGDQVEGEAGLGLGFEVLPLLADGLLEGWEFADG